MPTPTATDVQTLRLADLLDLPPTVDVETAGRFLGIGRTLAYQLVRQNKFPCKVIPAGRAYRVVTSDLRRVLGLPETGAAATA
ncbi:DNA-binding protein [Streptomyces sp. Vc74B-19]|uniref:helix-turn-helix domain-containing protein n=1 Tax=Streptomyces sp. Vc74B-19 TaxID=2741324 RepID=UPI001BFC129E|nr:helix-turn-helix domain-containing protein [Streptomyces sp. Vc74B-19]MBT3161544.1 DNA-binding protein [Streptomyces sp. Vc74B-19]